MRDLFPDRILPRECEIEDERHAIPIRIVVGIELPKGSASMGTLALRELVQDSSNEGMPLRIKLGTRKIPSILTQIFHNPLHDRIGLIRGRYVFCVHGIQESDRIDLDAQDRGFGDSILPEKAQH